MVGAARRVGGMAVSRTVAPEDVRAFVERTCAEQGVPVLVTDPAALRDVAVMLGQTRQTGATRSGSKRVRPGVAGRTTACARTAATIER